MGFDASAGRISVTDPTDADHITFDTDERLFIATDYAEGQIVVPERQSSSILGGRTIIDVDVDTVLASINPAADTVFGAFKCEVEGFDILASGGWFQATGSYHNARFSINDTGNPTPRDRVGGTAIYTFIASGGELIFNERTFIKCTLALGGTRISATLPAATIDYKLYCGSFV